MQGYPPGAAQPGISQPGYPQPGYPQPGYPQPGYPQYAGQAQAPPGYQMAQYPAAGYGSQPVSVGNVQPAMPAAYGGAPANQQQPMPPPADNFQLPPNGKEICQVVLLVENSDHIKADQLKQYHSSFMTYQPTHTVFLSQAAVI